jgi:AcrR family transcriptional regulator
VTTGAELNRRRIITAAREVFRDRGVSATLNDVARHAGVGVGTVYRRFSDKEELGRRIRHDDHCQQHPRRTPSCR